MATIEEFKMNITLRKASALQNAINETLKGLEVTTTATVDELVVHLAQRLLAER